MSAGRTDPFVMVPVWLFEAAWRTSGDLEVYGAIAGHADGSGIAWPSIAQLVAESGCSRASVYRSLDRLEAHGAILRESGGGRGRANRYQLVRSRVEAVTEQPGTLEGVGRWVGQRDAARAAANPVTGDTDPGVNGLTGETLSGSKRSHGRDINGLTGETPTRSIELDNGNGLTGETVSWPDRLPGERPVEYARRLSRWQRTQLEPTEPTEPLEHLEATERATAAATARASLLEGTMPAEHLELLERANAAAAERARQRREATA